MGEREVVKRIPSWAGLSGSAHVVRMTALAISMTFFLLRPSLTIAQGHGGHPRQAHHAGEWLRKYKDVPPAQQQKALENDPQFQKLSAERQQALRERLQRFNNLPPQQQQRVLSRMETWEHLTPAQKDQARQLHTQMQNLPPQRRTMVRQAVDELRSVPPDQRDAMIDSDRYKSQFTPEERNILHGVNRLPLAPPDTPPQGAQN